MTLLVSSCLSAFYHWPGVLENCLCTVESLPKEHPFVFRLGTIGSIACAGVTLLRYQQYSKQRFSVPECRKQYYLLQINLVLGILGLLFLGLFGLKGENGGEEKDIGLKRG